jgi:hypothetical protein
VAKKNSKKMLLVGVQIICHYHNAMAQKRRKLGEFVKTAEVAHPKIKKNGKHFSLTI